MSDALQVLWPNPQVAAASMSEKVAPWCRSHMAAGRRVVASFELEDDANWLQRLRGYWGYILRPISEQALIEGVGATPEGWHLYYKRMFLGYEFQRVRLPGSKRVTVRKVLRSVSKLAKNGKKFNEYAEKVRAHAASTFGVTFPVREDA
jgi:hypothetical protein